MTDNFVGRWAIYTPEGEIDCDPEPMIFETKVEAMAALEYYPSGYYVARVVA